MNKRFIAAFTAAASLLLLISPLGRAAEAPKTELVYTPTPQYVEGIYHNNLSEVELTGNQRLDVCNVALSQCGYHEGDSVNELHGLNLNG